MTDPKILSSISRPARYLGQEYNSTLKDWHSVKVRFGLIFPDLYEIGMSHQGLQILYHILNNNKNFLAERSYCPDTDVEQLLRTEKQQLTSLESGRPLIEFDVLGFTLPYELCYSNILTVLDLAHIPLFSKERDESYPLIIGGGACSMNPEPIADFFDAILLGDGEEAILEIGGLLEKLQKKDLPRKDVLNHLAAIESVYIPSHYSPEYVKEETGHQLVEMIHVSNEQHVVRRRVLPNLDNLEHLKTPLVPNAKIVHDRLGVEVARGCTRGCRFCQAGITYRPVRERTAEQVLELARDGVDHSGFEELALLSLSTGDYSCLEQTLPTLMDNFSDKYISVAMPSMRVGTLTPAIMEQVKRVRKTGFTLAPEAGSERLRQVINKGITEEDLLATCTKAYELGWRIIKCYFMIGLPTETEEDLEAIAQLVRKVMKTREASTSGGRKEVNVSVGTFVPKPHTPFQWEAQLSLSESQKALNLLRGALPRKGCNFKHHNPKISYLEGVFSRGDRKLGKLLVTAWKNGARLDGWTEHFNLDTWLAAAEQCHLELDQYLRARNSDELLPWSHLDTGVDINFLQDELIRAKEQVYTPDCRFHACQKCGLCDFKTLMPIVHNRKLVSTPAPVSEPQQKTNTKETAAGREQHFKYIVHYSRKGRICYLGHLEILQTIFRALRRAEIPTNFSKGFNPSPKVSFGPALPVGTESLAEYFIMDLYQPIKQFNETIETLNATLSPGLKVANIQPHSGKAPQKILVTYKLLLEKSLTESEQQKLKNFLECSKFLVSKVRKGKTKEIDIRPLIRTLTLLEEESVQIQMISEPSKASVKPAEAIAAVLGLKPTALSGTKIIKENWTALDE